MTEIHADLRALIVRARKDPTRWPGGKGLTQATVAAMAGTSQVYLRQIETGYTASAKAVTLGQICYVLKIKSSLLRNLGYEDVADSVEAAEILADPNAEQEAYVSNTPGLSDEEQRQLVDALRAIRRQEPYGREMWRRKTS